MDTNFPIFLGVAYKGYIYITETLGPVLQYYDDYIRAPHRSSPVITVVPMPRPDNMASDAWADQYWRPGLRADRRRSENARRVWIERLQADLRRQRDREETRQYMEEMVRQAVEEVGQPTDDEAEEEGGLDGVQQDELQPEQGDRGRNGGSQREATRDGGSPRVGDGLVPSLLDGLRHSGLAPYVPLLDPRFYYDLDYMRQQGLGLFPTYEQMDNLFRSERMQQDNLSGLKIRQAGALNQFVYPLEAMGGHSTRWDITRGHTMLLSHLIRRDPSNWLPCFDRSRWWTPAEVQTAYRRTTNWTVDNNKIWENLAVSLELVNRILKLLFKEQNGWLDAVMWGDRLEATLPGVGSASRDPILTPYPPGQSPKHDDAVGLKQRPKAQRPSPAEYVRRFNELSESLILTFKDEFSEDNEGQRMEALTCSHAIWQCRWPPVGSPRTREPIHACVIYDETKSLLCDAKFMEGEFASELGISFENEIFGGKVSFTGNSRRAGFWYAQGQLGIVFTPWPDPQASFRYNETIQSNSRVTAGASEDYMVNKEQRTAYHVPVYWVSTLLNEESWNWIDDSLGSQALRIPKILFANSTQVVNYSFNRQFSLRLLNVAAEGDTMTRRLVDICKRLREWERQSITSSGWYPQGYLRWQESPWSWQYARQRIEDFRIHHSQRNFAGATYCARRLLMIAGNLVWNPQLGHEYETFWIFEAIARLMFASMPFATSYPMGQPASTWNRVHFPSDAAKRRYPQWTNETFTFPSIIVATPNHIPKINGNTVQSPCDWVESAKDTIQHFDQQQSYAAIRWVRQVWDVLLDLREMRCNRRISDTEWGEFSFRVPDYDPVHWATASGPLTWYRQSVSKYQAENLRALQLDGRVNLTGYMKSPKIQNVSFRMSSSKAETRFEDRILKQLQHKDLEFAELVSCGKQGYRLYDSGIARELRASIKTRKPRGKLLQWIRPEEVAEFNGANEMPTFVSFGGDVFDITDFQYASMKEKELLHMRPGGVITFGRDYGQDAIVELLLRLKPYRCGLLMPRDPAPRKYQDLKLLTPNTLRLHDNPSDGIYTAIDGVVYDLSGYVDFHPGGRNILKGISGRDGTSEFYKCHNSDLLSSPEYAGLKVGRVITERSPGQIHENEMVLHGLVFNVQDLSNEDQFLHNAILPLFGSDATEKLVSEVASDSQISTRLAHFYDLQRGRVVAKIQAPRELGEVSTDDLARHADPATWDGAWVAVGNQIFDVTSLLRHRGWLQTTSALTEKHAGKEVTYKPLMEWLVKEQSHRIIATLRASKERVHEDVPDYRL
ncbi:uncharacterized protein JN550_010707 [Neoarthrinium moseri]|uniref:uncharacterized protein n=1 Tax=Neoarthrinium moseri TaxID=1658444 RepID=UPI001FDD9C8A|nr:uncharacterized protein JN550_010707 [Neoarthrinium moseri]KAI1861767.1 hypothetical protein JN550_010707 [Neoarthrinium moseri]